MCGYGRCVRVPLSALHSLLEPPYLYPLRGDPEVHIVGAQSINVFVGDPAALSHPRSLLRGPKRLRNLVASSGLEIMKGCRRRMTKRGLSSIRRSPLRELKRLRMPLEPSELKAAASSRCSLPRSDKIRPQARPYIRQVFLAGCREHAPRNAGGKGPRDGLCA